MLIISWALFGMIVGWVAVKTIGETGQRPAVDILLGIVGALGGGYFSLWLGGALVGPPYTYSMIEAVLCAVAVILARHAIINEMRTGPNPDIAPSPDSRNGTGIAARSESDPAKSRAAGALPYLRGADLESRVAGPSQTRGSVPAFLPLPRRGQRRLPTDVAAANGGHALSSRSTTLGGLNALNDAPARERPEDAAQRTRRGFAEREGDDAILDRVGQTARPLCDR